MPKRAGTIEVFGHNLDHLSHVERLRIGERWGVLFQEGALFSALTVRQNIQVPMREYLALSQDLMDELAMLKIRMVGLNPDAADKYPSELSGGMIKRAALARALAPRRDDRYEDVIEFMFALEHGPAAASVAPSSKSLYEANPLLFWQITSALLAFLLLVKFALQ